MNYERLYNKIINYAKSRTIVDGYTETHHIIPKSFGGSNDPTNLVVLTGREHYIVHRLLAKIYPKSGMVHAVYLMSCVDDGVKYGKITSRTYEYLRLQHSLRVSSNGESRIKLSRALKNKPQSSEHIRNRTESRKNSGKPWTTKETSEKISRALSGKASKRKNTTFTVEQHAAHMKGVETRKKNGTYAQSKASLEKAAETRKRNAPTRKKIELSDERKAQLSVEKSKKIICPHCGKGGQMMVMKRWHFDNCKHR